MNNKDKKGIRVLIFLIIAMLLILFILIFFVNKGLFYENVYHFLDSNEYSDRNVEEKFLIDNELYDDNFVCDTIVYENGSLEFFDCKIEVDYEKTSGSTGLNGYITGDLNLLCLKSIVFYFFLL